MLFKIFGIERSAARQSDMLPYKPRQLFVTQSRVLANRVQEYFESISELLRNSSPVPVEPLPPDETRNDLNIKVASSERLVDDDEEDEWRNDLPKRFSDLKDEHFPLFITFDKVRSTLPICVAR